MRRERTAAELYRRYGPVVYRRCLELLNDKAAARDATQQVFIGILARGAISNHPETALATVYAAATRYCAEVAVGHGEAATNAEAGGSAQ